MKNTIIGTTLAIGFGVGVGWFARSHHASSTMRQNNPTIEQVRELADLVLLQVTIGDVVTSRLDGHTGGLESVVIVRGDAAVGTDLLAARITSIDPAVRKAVILLPAPQVLRPRVDHDHTRIFEVQATGLWHILPKADSQKKLLDMAMEQAQRSVAHAAGQAQILQQARERAELLLTRFFQAMGWKVEVRWADGGPPSRAAAAATVAAGWREPALVHLEEDHG